jgi:hypothetical protein
VSIRVTQIYERLKFGIQCAEGMAAVVMASKKEAHRPAWSSLRFSGRLSVLVVRGAVVNPRELVYDL